MIVVYPIGVIGLYFYFLYHNRDAIMAIKAAETEEKKRKKEGKEGGDSDDHQAFDIGGHRHSHSRSHGQPDRKVDFDKDAHAHAHAHTDQQAFDIGSDRYRHSHSDPKVVVDKHAPVDAAAAAPHARGLTAAVDTRDLAAAAASVGQELHDGDPQKQQHGHGHGHGPIVGPAELTFLYRAYEGHVWYWEVVETARRLLLTAVVSVVGTGSAAQVDFGI